MNSVLDNIKSIGDSFLDLFLMEDNSEEVLSIVKKMSNSDLLDRIDELEAQIKYLLQEIEIYENAIGLDDKDYIKEILSVFEHNISNVLSHYKFSITKEATAEILYSSKYEKQLPYKCLSIVFKVALSCIDGLRPTPIKSVKKIHGLMEVRIDQKRRLYYVNNPNIILGFDFEHKSVRHDNIWPKLESRYTSITQG